MSAPVIASHGEVQPLDILAIAAHRDDVEQTCGGTLLKMAERSYRTGILDLTRGEMGTRGSAGDREREAAEAARILKASWRGALDIPDGRVENSWENKLKVARVLREQRPRVVILPYWKGRHPDHYTASTLGYEACFLAGLKKLDFSAAVPAAVVADPPPASLRAGRPQDSRQDAGVTHPIGLSRLFTRRFITMCGLRLWSISRNSSRRGSSPLMAYKTQFSDQEAGKDLFPAHKKFAIACEAMARFYGMLGGVEYAEPFLQKEVGLVEDLLMIPVKSI